MKPYVKEFLSKYVHQFETLNIDIHSLVLFGSQARGEATVSSDIDIAVVMKEDLTHFERGKLRCLGDDVDSRAEVNLFFTTQEAINFAQKDLDTNKYIREEGIKLWPK